MKNSSLINGFPVIWFTGLSASGKSTLSESLLKSLKDFGLENVILLDGESIREELNNFNFETSSREEIGYQKAKIALKLNKKDNIVIVTGIAHKKNWRNDIRSMFDNYIEIYLKCSSDACAKRDFKDNYRKAIAGELKNFIGVHEQYEEYEDYDLMVDTEKNNIAVCSKTILNLVLGLLNTIPKNNGV